MIDAKTRARCEVVFAAPFARRWFAYTVNCANVKADILLESVDFEAVGTHVLLERKQRNYCDVYNLSAMYFIKSN